MTIHAAAQVPLPELLRSVPINERLIIDHSSTSSSSIPVGPLAHVAADAIERLAVMVIRLQTALTNCVDYWPSALNDDLQERTFLEARETLAEIEKLRIAP